MVRPLLEVTRRGGVRVRRGARGGLNAAPSCSLIRLAAPSRTRDEGLATWAGSTAATDQEKPIAAAVRPGAAADWMPSLTSWSIMTQPCTRTWCNWSALLVLPGTRAMKTMPAPSRVTREEAGR